MVGGEILRRTTAVRGRSYGSAYVGSRGRTEYKTCKFLNIMFLRAGVRIYMVRRQTCHGEVGVFVAHGPTSLPACLSARPPVGLSIPGQKNRRQKGFGCGFILRFMNHPRRPASIHTRISDRLPSTSKRAFRGPMHARHAFLRKC